MKKYTTTIYDNLIMPEESLNLIIQGDIMFTVIHNVNLAIISNFALEISTCLFRERDANGFCFVSETNTALRLVAQHVPFNPLTQIIGDSPGPARTRIRGLMYCSKPR